MAQVTGNESRGILGAVNEKLLRIRAQPGSEWNEEGIKAWWRQLRNLKGMVKVGI